jgi:hypothetical protein
LPPAPSSGSVIHVKDATIKQKYIKGPQGQALDADHVVSLGVIQGGAQSLSAEFRELEDYGFFLVATMIDEVAYDLARLAEEGHAYDSVDDLVHAIARKKSGPLIDMFLHDGNLGQASHRDLKLDRELTRRNAGLDEAVGYLASRVMTAVDGKKVPFRE